MPADAPLLVPDECPRLEGTFLHPPRPPGVVPLMQAIEGDGSPWSYLSASILCREAEKLGATWHGCVWGGQTILSGYVVSTSSVSGSVPRPVAQRGIQRR